MLAVRKNQKARLVAREKLKALELAEEESRQVQHTEIEIEQGPSEAEKVEIARKEKELKMKKGALFVPVRMPCEPTF